MITTSEPNHYTPIPNTMANTKTISDVDAKALELINKQRAFEKVKVEFEKMKLDYLTMLMRQNIGGVDIKEGKIIVCTRTTKDYGHTVKVIESTLKAEKARLDHLLEFTIKSVTHYLRID